MDTGFADLYRLPLILLLVPISSKSHALLASTFQSKFRFTEFGLALAKDLNKSILLLLMLLLFIDRENKALLALILEYQSASTGIVAQ